MKAARAVLLAALFGPAVADYEPAKGVHNDTMLHWYSCTKQCIDVSHGEVWNGNHIQMWECIDTEPDQKWTITVNGNGDTAGGPIKWGAHENKCMQVTTDETSVELWDCIDGEPRQQFSLSEAATGHIHWAHHKMDKCLDVNEAKTANGNRINLASCSAATVNQNFFPHNPAHGLALPFEGCRAGVVDQIDAPGVMSMSEELCQERCQPDNEPKCGCAVFRTSDSRCLVLEECPSAPAPLPLAFPVELINYKVLMPKHVPTPHQQAVMHNTSLYWFSCTDECLDVSAGEAFNGNTIQLWKCYPAEMDQRFSIPVNGQGQIIWTPHPTKCIQVTQDTSSVELWDCMDDEPRQNFDMRVGHDDKGHIHWHKDPTLCLDVDQAKRENGNRINLGGCDSLTINQMWFAAQPPSVLPYQGCRAHVMDDIFGLPESEEGYTQKECQDKCDNEWCGCAIFRVEDGRCLIERAECPAQPAPLPDHFPVEQYNYKVLKKGPFPGRVIPYVYERNPPTDQVLPVLREPHLDAEEVGLAIKPGETVLCSEMMYGPPDGVVYCHVNDTLGHKGWIPFNEPGGLKFIHPRLVPRWEHQPLNGKEFGLLSEPRLDAQPTGEKLPIGWKIDAIKMVEGKDGILFLLSANPYGWVVNRLPEEGKQMDPLDAEMWISDPEAGDAGIPLLKEHDMGSGHIGSNLKAGQHFFVAEKFADTEDAITFLRPRNEKGWVAHRKGTEPLDPQPSLWIYDSDGEVWFRDEANKPTAVLAEGHMGAKPMGAEIEPDQVFQVLREVIDGDGNEFLELADGRGWVEKTRDGKHVSFPWPRTPMPYIYDPKDKSRTIPVLSKARPDAAKIGIEVKPGEVLLVSEKRMGPDGIEYLKLMDHKGWIPGDKLVEGQDDAVVRPLRLREWRYSPPGSEEEQTPFTLYSEPHFDAGFMGEKLYPGEVFQAIEEVESDNLVLFLKPLGTTGWIPVTHPEQGTLSEFIPSEMWTYGAKGSKPFELLGSPKLESAELGLKILGGSTFYIDEKHVGDAGTTFVKPRGEHGWIYEQSMEQEQKQASKLDPQPSLWIYDPDEQINVHSPDNKPIAVSRSSHEGALVMNTPAGMIMQPETVFGVIGEDNELFELADGRGFVPKTHCVPWPRSAPFPWWIVALLALLALAALLAFLLWPKQQEKRTFDLVKTPPSQKGETPRAGFVQVTAPPKKAAAVVEQAVYTAPVTPYLSMHFQDKGCKGEDGIREYKFEQHPLGLQFKLVAPIIINGYTKSGIGEQLGVKKGSTLIYVGNETEGEVVGSKIDVRGKTYDDIWEILKMACYKLPATPGVNAFMGTLKDMAKRDAELAQEAARVKAEAARMA